VKEIHPLPGGDHALILRDGNRLTLSRGYREHLERLLRSWDSLRLSRRWRLSPGTRRPESLPHAPDAQPPRDTGRLEIRQRGSLGHPN